MPGTADRALPALLTARATAAAWCGAAVLVLSWLAYAAAFAERNGAGVLVPALGTAVILAAGLAVPAPARLRAGSTALAVAGMVAGFAVVLGGVGLDPARPHSTAVFALSFVKMAVVLLCLRRPGIASPVVAAVGAALACEGLCLTLGGSLGYPWGFDGPEAAVLLVAVAGSLGLALSGRSARTARASFASVEREEAVRSTRRHVRGQAAAVVHDTVLNDLAVVAAIPPGPLPPRVAARLAATLELLAATDWARRPDAARDAVGGPLAAVVERAIADGLQVALEGDLEALDALDPERREALAGAVEQCLANTARHSGVSAAAVSVLGDATHVSVLVSDDGSGFDPDRVAQDRLGLRRSVLQRIEGAGGSTRLFTSPGSGTTVLLTLPRATALVEAG